MKSRKEVEAKLSEYRAKKDKAQARAEKYLKIAKEKKLTDNEGQALVRARREVSQMHMNISLGEELLAEGYWSE